jgi:hypothetical protein
MLSIIKKISPEDTEALIAVLKQRFEKNPTRHTNFDWTLIEQRLRSDSKALNALAMMEETGGEPDVVWQDENGAFLFYDCSAESPKGRRSICYDADALASRKEHKPKHSAMGMAEEMGITILNEDQYRFLQTLGKFDSKTSSWISTPEEIRTLGGALFCDYRYGQVFTYHNGAESYYAVRGFRGMIKV